MEEIAERTLDLLKMAELWHQFRQGEGNVWRKGTPSVVKPDVLEEYRCLCCGNTMRISKLKGPPRRCHVCGTVHWNDPEYGWMKGRTESQRRHCDLLHGMVDRCYNSGNTAYDNYGARGIGVDSVWYDASNKTFHFEIFSKWCEDNGWAPGLQIDRIDNEKGYCPSNCRFVSGKENLRNRRTNIYVTVGGKTRCIGEWSEISGVKYHTLRRRIKSGWDPERAMLIPDKWNRPHLCFHRGLNGKACLRNGGRCKCLVGCSDDDMRSCPFFFEYRKGVEVPMAPKRRNSSYRHFKKMKDARIGL